MKQLELAFSAIAHQPRDGELLQSARRLLHAAGCGNIAEKLRVEWNTRMRTSAGLACHARTLVMLNPRICEFGIGEIENTLRHELAHLVAQFRAGRRLIAPHGVEWRKACADLGIAGEPRCHSIPLPRRRVPPRLLYRCPSCRLEIRRVHPFRRVVACRPCCRAHNGGKYDDKFRLRKCPAPLHS